jgi:hypothetical protein
VPSREGIEAIVCPPSDQLHSCTRPLNESGNPSLPLELAADGAVMSSGPVACRCESWPRPDAHQAGSRFFVGGILCALRLESAD